MVNKRGKISNWITFFIFILAIAFLILFTIYKGDFNAMMSSFGFGK